MKLRFHVIKKYMTLLKVVFAMIIKNMGFIANTILGFLAFE
jgi:hypothetical protein